MSHVTRKEETPGIGRVIVVTVICSCGWKSSPFSDPHSNHKAEKCASAAAQLHRTAMALREDA